MYTDTTDAGTSVMSPAAPGESTETTTILLDLFWVRILLDGVGAIALFGTLVLASTVRDAVLLTALIAAFVVVSRLVRWFLGRAPRSAPVRAG